MNERIRELVLEAGFVHYGEDMGFYNIPVPAFNGRMEKFAELIYNDIITVVAAQALSNDSALDVFKNLKRIYEGDKIKEHFGVAE